MSSDTLNRQSQAVSHETNFEYKDIPAKFLFASNKIKLIEGNKKLSKCLN